MPNDPQVPWTDEQWARVNQVVQEEAKRARVAATFLPLYGPLGADADFIRRQDILYSAPAATRTAALADYGAALQAYNSASRPPPDFATAADAQLRMNRLAVQRLGIDDRDTIRLATLQVIVPVRNAQMADPELTSALALFRRAANVLARLEDAVIFQGLAPTSLGGFAPPRGLAGLPAVWQITGALAARGLWTRAAPPQQWIRIPFAPPRRGNRLVSAVSAAIGRLEGAGQFGPFAAVFGQGLFLVAQTPDLASYALPQDRIIPFLSGGPLLRSSTLDELNGYSGLVVALGGSPVELVVATDVSLQFLQVSAEPTFLFRVSEKIALRIKEPDAIIQLYMI
jgi:uncharacterized linocin/CFP29 family protein